jgi:uncharacterized Fe-S cluster protein YjdI
MTDYRDRKSKTKKPRETFLIVCEGEKTEPNYFKSFPVLTNTVVDIHGLGNKVTVSLVKKAIELRDNNKYEYDQVWCVFDGDSNPDQQFNQALKLAAQKNIKVAYSVEAFEIWYILHYQYQDTAMSRDAYINVLDKQLKKEGYSEYQKNREDMYKILKNCQSAAIKNAKRLFKTYQEPYIQPCDANPCTTIYELVEELNKHLRP